jgi:hypothetical protein
LNSVVLELNALLAALLQHLHTHAYAMTGEGLGRKPFIRIVFLPVLLILVRLSVTVQTFMKNFSLIREIS